jgi:hypothetical protein
MALEGRTRQFRWVIGRCVIEKNKIKEPHEGNLRDREKPHRDFRPPLRLSRERRSEPSGSVRDK